MIVTKLANIQLAKDARKISEFVLSYHNVMPKKYKYTFGDILLTEINNLNKCCRRACYVFDAKQKAMYLEEAELLIVDIVGVMEVLFDAKAITTEHKARFDVMAIGIGKQVSALRKVTEKRLGSIEGPLTSE